MVYSDNFSRIRIVVVNLAKKVVVINSKDGLYDMEKDRNFMLLYSSFSYSIYYYLQKNHQKTIANYGPMQFFMIAY